MTKISYSGYRFPTEIIQQIHEGVVSTLLQNGLARTHFGANDGNCS